jgi:hypothetical protein
MTTSARITALLTTLTPTGRLVVKELALTSPTSAPYLCVSTGATPGHLDVVLRELVKQGILARSGSGASAMYALDPAYDRDAHRAALDRLATRIVDDIHLGMFEPSDPARRTWRWDKNELVVSTHNHINGPLCLGWLGMYRFDLEGLMASLVHLIGKNWCTERDLLDIASVYVDRKAGVAR